MTSPSSSSSPASWTAQDRQVAQLVIDVPPHPRSHPHVLCTLVAGTGETDAGDATELKWEFDKDLGHYYVSFPDDQ